MCCAKSATELMSEAHEKLLRMSIEKRVDADHKAAGP